VVVSDKMGGMIGVGKGGDFGWYSFSSIFNLKYSNLNTYQIGGG
jgi:hypothetical protein